MIFGVFYVFPVWSPIFLWLVCRCFHRLCCLALGVIATEFMGPWWFWSVFLVFFRFGGPIFCCVVVASGYCCFGVGCYATEFMVLGVLECFYCFSGWRSHIFAVLSGFRLLLFWRGWLLLLSLWVLGGFEGVFIVFPVWRSIFLLCCRCFRLLLFYHQV
jgi:hypothetical protein